MQKIMFNDQYELTKAVIGRSQDTDPENNQMPERI